VESVRSDPSRLIAGSRPTVSNRGVTASVVSSVEPEGDLRPCVARGTDAGGALAAERSVLLDGAPLVWAGNGRVPVDLGLAVLGTSGDLTSRVDLGVSFEI